MKKILLILLLSTFIACNNNKITNVVSIYDLELTTIKYNNKSKVFLYSKDEVYITYQRSVLRKINRTDWSLVGELYLKDRIINFVVLKKKEQIYFTSDDEIFYINSKFRMENNNNEVITFYNKNKNDYFEKIVINEIFYETN